MPSESTFSVKLFYSYSHADGQHRDTMESALALLRNQDGVLDDWSDQKIRPGQNISNTIKEKIRNSDICIFLMSQDFLASGACREEWRLAGEVPSVTRVPIILSDCPWKDMDNAASVKALPKDGKPIKSFGKRETAWKQIYDGLKGLINDLRANFEVRTEFREEVEKTEFLSTKHVGLQSIFVFPQLSL